MIDFKDYVSIAEQNAIDFYTNSSNRLVLVTLFVTSLLKTSSIVPEK